MMTQPPLKPVCITVSLGGRGKRKTSKVQLGAILYLLSNFFLLLHFFPNFSTFLFLSLFLFSSCSIFLFSPFFYPLFFLFLRFVCWFVSYSKQVPRVSERTSKPVNETLHNYREIRVNRSRGRSVGCAQRPWSSKRCV